MNKKIKKEQKARIAKGSSDSIKNMNPAPENIVALFYLIVKFKSIFNYVKVAL